MLRKILLLLLCIVVLSGCMLTNAKKMDVENSSSKVVLGIERVTEPEFSKLFKGKRLGLFTNQTGVDSMLRSSVDILRGQYNLSAILFRSMAFMALLLLAKSLTIASIRTFLCLACTAQAVVPAKKCWIKSIPWWWIFRMWAYATTPISPR